MYDATETSVSISGIFQAPDDFAVLGWWNAFEYYNHLRCKHLPRTGPRGLKLEFDIECDDHALDGASVPNSVALAAGTDGTWETIDGISPVMTEGTRRWIKDLAGHFQSAGIKAKLAFSMECRPPPAAMGGEIPVLHRRRGRARRGRRSRRFLAPNALRRARPELSSQANASSLPRQRATSSFPPFSARP